MVTDKVYDQSNPFKDMVLPLSSNNRVRNFNIFTFPKYLRALVDKKLLVSTNNTPGDVNALF